MMKWNAALLWTRSVISSSGDRTINSVGAVGGGGASGSPGGLRSGADLTGDTASRTENRDLEQGVSLEVVQANKTGRQESDMEKGIGAEVGVSRIGTTSAEILPMEKAEAGPSEQGADLESGSSQIRPT